MLGYDNTSDSHFRTVVGYNVTSDLGVNRTQFCDDWPVNDEFAGGPLLTPDDLALEGVYV